MKLPDEVVALLRCPHCSAPVEPVQTHFLCTSDSTHRFEFRDGILTFGQPSVEKYDEEYAARYAAIWAFGSETIHSGLTESLYLTIAALVARSLTRIGKRRSPVIVDCGCGVGRVLADSAAFAPDGLVIGIDGAAPMLRLASEIVCGDSEVTLDLSRCGFGELSIVPRSAENVCLLRGDITRVPLAGDSADLVISVNTVDRPEEGPERVLAECHRILRSGGSFILADPLNWDRRESWERFPDADSILSHLRSLGLKPVTWFDDLRYKELMDARGSVSEYRTLVVQARKD